MKFFSAITLASLASFSSVLAMPSASTNDASCGKYIYNTFTNTKSTDVYHWREVMNDTKDDCVNSNDACGKILHDLFKNNEFQDVWNWKHVMGTPTECTTANEGSCSRFLYDTFQNKDSTDMANWKRIMGTGRNPCN
ncbi:hypothetical protein BDV27DRAFT_137162 [Aspergillus caelatus]|uniref:Uncharacterized protein n=2 Tax=Aspergillus subgen. Circumdati TaxID=2720871 RepID=A0A5N6ZN16_9EURO|nr:uncharacterized protein BDV27DRAFT_137162 [Aspergillus caelatus]KAE8358768.1 hypothetical protein BDV27DRAFT_137162 [Aspergillus caelatus]KAE8411982.1 hypothetical protein BDV36DRAFT_272817 [Aspergillus pseudocaelatus]